MIIPFELDTAKWRGPKLFYGNKQRYSAMTSVVFITKNLLVCASYHMTEMYLVEFDLDSERWDIIHTIQTLGITGKAGSTDLIDYWEFDDGTKQLITSDFTHKSVSIYHIVENDTKLKYIHTIHHELCGYCHGVSYHFSQKDIIFFTTTGTKNPYCGVYAFKIDKAMQHKLIFGFQEKGWLGKDVTFFDHNKMVVVWCDNAPNPSIKRRYSTKVATYQIDLQHNKSKKLDEIIIHKHHTDACFYRNGRLYITVEGVEEKGRVIVYDLDKHSGKITHSHDICNDYYFPHGIDINFGMIAIAQYGRSDVVINKFDEEIGDIVRSV